MTLSLVDLDHFYSMERISTWKLLIGERLHYHHGYFETGDEAYELAAIETVRRYFPYIATNAKVLDVGCGWGGPAQLLRKERSCQVTGVTISEGQATYCQSIGLSCVHHNLELGMEDFDNDYDVAFSLEMISHIADRRALLSNLRKRANILVLSENCRADYLGAHNGVSEFGGSMLLPTPQELIQDLAATGWKIKWQYNRRIKSLPSFVHWKNGLEYLFDGKDPGGHFGVLLRLCDKVLEAPVIWAQKNPLMDFVAE